MMLCLANPDASPHTRPRPVLRWVAIALAACSTCCQRCSAQTAAPEQGEGGKATQESPDDSSAAGGSVGAGRGGRAAVAPGEPYVQTIPGSEVAFEMAPIPSGMLRLLVDAGSAEASAAATIRIAPFWMGRHEVTWSEYWEFMKLCDVFEKFDDQQTRQLDDARAIDAVTAPSKLYEPSFTYSAGDGPRHPAVSMSQFAAKQYTKWLSLTTGAFYRLPTDAEWEYACRAGSETIYSFGDDAEDLAAHGWFFENADDATHEAGSKRPNAWGLYDMHGNAREWTLDEFRPDWYLQFSGKTIGALDAVCWPQKLYPRVLRGGGWRSDPPDCTSGARHGSDDDAWRSYDPNSPQSPWWFASDASQDVGFRIVRPVEAPPRAQWSRYWDADLESIQKVVDHRIDNEGRGRRGKADLELPAAIERLRTPPTKESP